MFFYRLHATITEQLSNDYIKLKNRLTKINFCQPARCGHHYCGFLVCWGWMHKKFAKFKNVCKSVPDEKLLHNIFVRHCFG